VKILLKLINFIVHSFQKEKVEMNRIYDESKSDSEINDDVTLKVCSCNSNTINSSGIVQVNETISMEDISTNELKIEQCDNENPVINNDSTSSKKINIF